MTICARPACESRNHTKADHLHRTDRCCRKPRGHCPAFLDATPPDQTGPIPAVDEAEVVGGFSPVTPPPGGSTYIVPEPDEWGFGPDSSHTGPLRLWSPSFMDTFGGPGAMSQAQILEQADYVELFYARKSSANNYPAYLTQMRARREGLGKLALKTLYYDLQGGVDSPRPDDPGAHTADQYCYPTATPPPLGQRNDTAFRTVANDFHVWIMRLEKQGYIDSMIANYRTEHAPYDGSAPDVMGIFPAVSFHNTAGDPRPYNFDLGNASAWYTPERWLDFVVECLRQMHEDAPGVPLFPNGISNGTSYFEPTENTRRLLGPSTGAMVELWARPPEAAVTAFHPESRWLQDIDMLIDASTTKSKPLLCCTKLWPSTAATQGDSKRWFAYSLGCFLIGTDGRHMWHYRHDRPSAAYVTGVNGTNVSDGTVRDDMKGRHHWYPGGPDCNFFGSNDRWLDRVNLGGATQNLASGSAYKVITNAPASGRYLYVRQFARGIVLANPTANPCDYTISSLASGHSYQNIDGTPVAYNATVTVAAHTAKIISRV